METENLASLEALMLKVTVGTSAASSDGAAGLDSAMVVTGGRRCGGGALDVKQGQKAAEEVGRKTRRLCRWSSRRGHTTGREDGSKVGWLVDGDGDAHSYLITTCGRLMLYP